MKAVFLKSMAKGTAVAPPSKSDAHRALICAALANGESVVRGVSRSEDLLATLDCVAALGAKVTWEGDDVRLRGGALPLSDRFPCRESGSTLRFFLPLALLRDTPCTFTGSPRLLERPQNVYEELCREQNLRFTRSEKQITVCGKLHSGEFSLRGDLSSQFFTGLLFALPQLEGDSRIRILPPFESASYVDLTERVLRSFGITIRRPDPLTLEVPGGQTYRAADVRVEGDYSNAAFLDAFSLIGGEVRVMGLNPDSRQGDRVYRDFFGQLAEGCPTLDIRDCPDLAPVLMALGGMLHGVTLTGTARLRIKESDRGAAMAAELQKCGIFTDLSENRLTVRGGTLQKPSVPLDGHNDHRVVMACSLLLSAVGGSILGAEAVRKSYPDFFDVIRNLGIEVTTDATDEG